MLAKKKMLKEDYQRLMDVFSKVIEGKTHRATKFKSNRLKFTTKEGSLPRRRSSRRRALNDQL